jgi:hypothetical protein
MSDQSNRGIWTSASNAQADSLCPGRHQAQKGINDTDSESAEFGTQIHAALANGNSAGLSAAQESIYESVLEIEKKILSKYYGPEVLTLQPAPICERRFWAIWPDGFKHSGQVDRAHRKGVKALILDVKSLAGEVAESPRNMQLRDLACLFDIGTTALLEVAVAIIQPLVTHSPELCVYNRSDLNKARLEMYLRVSASNKPDAPRVPGAVQCKFCRAKAVCSEYSAYASALVPAPKDLVSVPVSQWTPEMRQSFCDNFDMAQKWLDGCWAALEAGAMGDPDFVPGYAMKDGQSRSKIVNLQAVFDRASGVGVPLVEFLAQSTVSKESLTEMVRKATSLKGKKLTDEVSRVIGTDFVKSECRQSLKKL